MARENDLLTDAELIEFTGYQKASKQGNPRPRRRLVHTRPGRRPMVTWTHINAVLNGQITVQTSTEEKPDLELFKWGAEERIWR